MYRIPFIVRKRSISFAASRNGLGNRVIPMGCILAMATELNYRPVIFWENAEVVGGAQFKDLFDDTNLPFELVTGYEARVMGVTLFHKKYIPLSLPKRMITKLINLLVLNQYDKHVWFEGVKGYRPFREQPIAEFLKYSKVMVNGSRIFNYAYDLSWLKPATHIASHIVELKKRFAPNTVGVHIRGTDRVYIPPIEKIIAKMRAEVELDPEVKFFLASDGDERGEEIVDTFGDRLIMYKNTRSFERRTLPGNQDAIVDLFGLAATSRIIGMDFSSFPILAAMIGNKPLLMIHAVKLTKHVGSYRDHITSRERGG